MPGQQFSADFDPGFDPDVPAPHTFIPSWLAPADVKEWLRLNDQDTDDDALIQKVSAQAEPYVQERRPEWWRAGETGRVYVPDAETYQTAVMYAAREYRRRNSPAGIESFGDGGTSFVSRYDPDIDRGLRINSYARTALA